MRTSSMAIFERIVFLITKEEGDYKSFDKEIMDIMEKHNIIFPITKSKLKFIIEWEETQ